MDVIAIVHLRRCHARRARLIALEGRELIRPRQASELQRLRDEAAGRLRQQGQAPEAGGVAVGGSAGVWPGAALASALWGWASACR